MQFTLTEDQRQLQATVERFVRDHYGLDDWRSAARREPGFREALWREMAELGWLAACIPETYGGLGLGTRERAILMEGIGRGLVQEPFWSTAVLGVELLLACASESQKQQWLPQVGGGSLRLAAALLEPHARYDWADVRCRADRQGSGWRLSGDKIGVLDAASAHRLLVLARTGDRPGDLALFCVNASAEGIVRRDAITLDERRMADIELRAVTVDDGSRLQGEAGLQVQEAIDHALVALAAESVGAMAAALEATLEYLKTRRQFGKTLSEFQALRHRVADMVMATEQTRSLTLLAAGEPSRERLGRARLAAAVKVQAGQAGRFVGENAVQLHGGIGVTDELQVGHHLKRLMVSDYLLGDSAHHLRRFAAMDVEMNAT
jgi:alkylation response protein AidB-like acyl-CoA dehydrogenase